MSDHHHHHHQVETVRINRAFIGGIILNIAFVIIEFIAGYYQSSLGLISDAGHNLTDVFSLLLSLFAFRMMRIRANENYSYGYKKAGILVSLFNAICLVLAVAFILYEGVERLRHPQPMNGGVISAVAFIGILVNAVSAFLFMKGKDRDINVKGAYLHLLSDALVSAGVMVAGIVIYYTHWYWVDILISTVVAVVILVTTWRLLLDSVRLALDGTPRDIDVAKVKATILKFDMVSEVYHVHIWALSSSQNALTAHLVLKEADLNKFSSVKKQIKHELEHLNIHHATFEIETAGTGSHCATDHD